MTDVCFTKIGWRYEWHATVSKLHAKKQDMAIHGAVIDASMGLGVRPGKVSEAH